MTVVDCVDSQERRERTNRGCWRAACSLITLCAICTPAVYGQVEVTLTNGTMLRVDRIGAESDGRRCAVKVENSRMVLTRFVPWTKVASAKIGNRVYSARQLIARFTDGRAAELTEAAAELTSKTTAIAVKEPPASTMVISNSSLRAEGLAFGSAGLPTVYGPGCVNGRVVGIHDDPLNAYANEIRRFFPHGIPVLEAGFARQALRESKLLQIYNATLPAGSVVEPVIPVPPAPTSQTASVRSIQVQARPISSRGKADWDALRLDVVALDGNGDIVVVDGTLQATLWGARQQLVRRHTIDPYRFFFYPSDRQVAVEAIPGRTTKIASWTRSVKAESRQFVLPFPRALPDHDLRLAPYGDLHVRLMIPGQGVFETRYGDIALRQESLLRQQHFVQSGSRFFPGEGTTGRRISRNVPFDDSPFTQLYKPFAFDFPRPNAAANPLPRRFSTTSPRFATPTPPSPQLNPEPARPLPQRQINVPASRQVIPQTP